MDHEPEQPSESAGQRELLTGLFPRLSQLSGVLTRGHVFENAVAATGITLERPALSVLLTLHTAGRPLRIGEIATRMQVVGPHVTRHVSGLEQRGLVQRVTDPTDQRARLIEPTPDGASATERYVGAVFAWFAEAMVDWPEHDRLELGRLLGRLVDDLTARIDTAGGDPT